MHQQLIDLIYYEYLFNCERENPEYIKKRYSHLYPVISHGHKYWYNDLCQLHREGDKPAVILANNSREWWCRGICHREKIDSNGTRLPAVIYASGIKEWWVNGKRQ